jgi:hypothetical protein
MRPGASKRTRYRPRFIDRFGLWISVGEHIDGLWVGTVEIKSGPVLCGVRNALGLIKTHDPVRYRRLTRDLKRIWVTRDGGPVAHFAYRLDACVLNTRFVLSQDSTPELIAAAIVHEATHARLWGYGIGYDEELRSRVEAVCIRRELAFCAKLPDGQRVREWCEYKLAWCRNRANLSDEGLAKQRTEEAKQHREETVRELLQLGVPLWFIRTVFATRRAMWRVVRLSRRLRALVTG